MIPLALRSRSDAAAPFVTRLSASHVRNEWESEYVRSDGAMSLFCGSEGLFEIESDLEPLDGDVVLIDPVAGRAERLIRAGSRHNTLLVTERCDQLCIMCSQPPKKSHVDRFALLEQACLLAPPDHLIGISGGEPTLFADELLGMLETVLTKRPDLQFHVLTNGQHFVPEHLERLRVDAFRRVAWGVPLYAADAGAHDEIVCKSGAHDRLMESLALLFRSRARIELRTVLMKPTLPGLSALSRLVARDLPHIEQWSLMGLENIGFARNRWADLAIDHKADFYAIADALSAACLHGVSAKLFNIPLCFIPERFRPFAVDSISDWKKRYSPRCEPCSSKAVCSGFFEWHPESILDEVVPS